MGIMENKMETTIKGFRVQGHGDLVSRLLMRIIKVTIRVIGAINLLTTSH